MKTIKECIDCGYKMEIPDDAIRGEIVSCKDCGADWEIASPRLDLVKAERINEDWGE